MPLLALNGIDIAPVVSATDAPKAARRDIGDAAPAADGTRRLTRQARKRDLEFETVPLSLADALAWEGLFLGDGHVWSFDSSVYSSKGAIGSTVIPSEIELDGTVKKFGAKALKVFASSSWNGFLGSEFDATGKWTVAAWRRIDAGAWVHLVVRSDGAKWVNGVRNDSYATGEIPGVEEPFTDVPAVVLRGGSGTTTYWDDVVACPFRWLPTWPAAVYATGVAFSPLPYLRATGSLVTEAVGFRLMLGTCDEAELLMAKMGGALQNDVHKLSVSLQEA